MEKDFITECIEEFLKERYYEPYMFLMQLMKIRAGRRNLLNFSRKSNFTEARAALLLHDTIFLKPRVPGRKTGAFNAMLAHMDLFPEKIYGIVNHSGMVTIKGSDSYEKKKDAFLGKIKSENADKLRGGRPNHDYLLRDKNGFPIDPELGHIDKNLFDTVLKIITPSSYKPIQPIVFGTAGASEGSKYFYDLWMQSTKAKKND